MAGMDSGMDSGVRIGDAERERVAATLSEQVGAGRLDLAEYEQRVDRVYAARTAADLAAVLADLPATPTPRPTPRSTPAPRARTLPAPAAWAPWAATTVICLVIWLATSLGAGHALYFWPMWVAGPWGAMLLLGGVTGRGTCARPTLPR